MSLIERLGQDFCNLPSILEEYENALENVENVLQVKGKTLEVANREQSSWVLYFETRRAELHTLVKYFEGKTAATRSRLFKHYTENYNRELNDNQKNKYIDNEDQYLMQYEIYLEVKDIHDRYEAICTALIQRGYSLNNITKIRIASIENDIIG